ncbi:two-component system activity regulator YycH [Leuconostoc palmae]|uniref:two-component system activity regulator YycH n=1 Tax=Leuconostoc palmae TaxID=501487 RepID=UPI001C7D3334|nr:two-component system activity regulator YycH [Leuconostoc palmae]
MRNKNQFLHSVIISSLLVVSIIVSVVLTGFIFSSFGRSDIADSANIQQPEQQTQLFRPTQFIVNKTNGKQFITLTGTGQQSQVIDDAVSNSKMSQPETNKVTTSKVEDILATKKAHIFRYPDVIPVTYFNAKYGQSIKHNQPFNFDYFVLPFDQKKVAYFVNSQTNEVTKVRVAKFDFTKIWQKINNLPDDVPIRFKTYQDRVILNYAKQIKLPVYSYLINQRDPKIYVSALLGTINQLSVTQDGDKTVYTNKLNNQKLIYDPDWETVTFEDKNPKNKLPTDYLGRLNLAFSQINLLQLNLNDTRFYESRESGQKLTFRTYVKGFPVYFQSESGAIHIEMQKNGNQQATYSLNEIGVPVPNNSAQVTLPDTDTILNRLHDAGIKSSDYNFITPGYEWLINQDSQAAVNMVPTWMIETHDGWQSVDSYLKNKTVNDQSN